MSTIMVRRAEPKDAARITDILHTTALVHLFIQWLRPYRETYAGDMQAAYTARAAGLFRNGGLLTAYMAC